MRYLFLTVLSGYFLIQDLFNHRPFYSLWILVLIAIIFIIKKIEQNKNTKIPLIMGEKIGVVVTSLLLGFISTAFYYFCLKNLKSLKAQQSIKYSLYSSLVLFIPIVLIVALNDVIKFLS